MKKSVLLWGVLLLVVGCGRAPEEEMAKETDLFPETTIEVPQEKQQMMPSAKIETPAAEQTVAAPIVTQSLAVPSQPVEMKRSSTSKQYTAKDIQQALTNCKLYEGRIDGKIGPKTKKAIEAFQRKNNLKADGIVGPRTWEKLRQFLSAPETESSSTVARTNLTTN